MLFYDKLKKSRVAGHSGVHCDNTAGAGSNTNIQDCIQKELTRYFELLDGQAPSELYRLVMSQVESTLIAFVLEECGNNQSKAAEYLGISRGTLRNKLTEQGLL